MTVKVWQFIENWERYVSDKYIYSLIIVGLLNIEFPCENRKP